MQIPASVRCWVKTGHGKAAAAAAGLLCRCRSGTICRHIVKARISLRPSVKLKPRLIKADGGLQSREQISVRFAGSACVRRPLPSPLYLQTRRTFPSHLTRRKHQLNPHQHFRNETYLERSSARGPSAWLLPPSKPDPLPSPIDVPSAAAAASDRASTPGSEASQLSGGSQLQRRWVTNEQ